jgi:hypothetical protein
VTVSAAEWMAATPRSTGASDFWAEDYGRELRGIITRHANLAPRSVQKHLGPSELGHPCDRQVVGKMAGAKVTNHVADPWASIVGTSIHAYMAEAFERDNRHNQYIRWLTEKRVTPDPGPDPHPGTADLYDAFNRCVVDWKAQGESTRSRLKTQGPPRHYFVQILLYARGYRNLGLPVDRVAIVSLPRTKSTLDDMYVWSHVPTAEDERLVDDVLVQTRFRQQLAQLVRAGRVDLMDVPAVPEATECYFCLSGDTEVVTRQGIQRIRELSGMPGGVDLLVPSVTATGRRSARGTFQRVPVKKFGEQELLKVTLQDRRVEKVVYATKEHNWFVTDRMRVQRNGARIVRHQWRRTTAELQPGDLLQPLRRTSTQDPGLMQVAVAQGFVFGDGTSSYNDVHERPAHLSVYANGKDDAILKFFDGFPRSEQGGHTFIYGMPRFWKRLPPLDESRSFLLSWLAGYFAADGSVTDEGMCALASAKQANLDFVRSLAAVCGVGYRPVAASLRVGTGTEETPLYELPLRRRDLPPWFFLISKHRERAETANAKPDRETYWKVKSVEPTGRVEPVYCAVTGEPEAFALADDLMTGNCGLYRPQAAYDGAYGCPGTIKERKRLCRRGAGTGSRSRAPRATGRSGAAVRRVPCAEESGLSRCHRTTTTMTTEMRNPETAAAVRLDRTVTAAGDVPRMEAVRARLRLEVLERTEPGDVFYLITDPSRVYLRSPRESRWPDDHRFTEMEDDVWRQMLHVGDGGPAQVVVVLHNIRKYCTAPET